MKNNKRAGKVTVASRPQWQQLGGFARMRGQVACNWSELECGFANYVTIVGMFLNVGRNRDSEHESPNNSTNFEQQSYK